MKIQILNALSDNFLYLIIQNDCSTILVDAGEASPVVRELEKRNLKLDSILITHHHSDHIAGLTKLKEKFPNVKIFALEGDSQRIKEATDFVKDGDLLDFPDFEIKILHTPGHTSGHICYYLEKEKIIFTADTLFVSGCGRLFEGTAEEMFRSLQRLKSLPDETLVYCGHEYTIGNLKFALSVDPNNPAIKEKLTWAKLQLEKNLPTTPSTIGEEKIYNPFLRATTVEEFANLRSLKDRF